MANALLRDARAALLAGHRRAIAATAICTLGTARGRRRRSSQEREGATRRR